MTSEVTGLNTTKVQVRRRSYLNVFVQQEIKSGKKKKKEEGMSRAS